MTPRDVRAMLRGATRDRVIEGWYFYGDPHCYVVNGGPRAAVLSAADVVPYCEMLAAAGVAPLYRN